MRRVMVLLVFLASTTTAHAGSVLAVSWQPAFCETHRAKAECRTQTEERYDAANFTLHGLWPDKKSYCGVSQKDVALDKEGKWEHLPEVTTDRQTRADLEKYMPGVQSYLERHEWTKHGTCSGMTSDAYYDRAIKLLGQVNTSQVADLVRNNIGKKIPLKEIQRAISRSFGTTTGKSAKINCEGKNLVEIQFYLKDDTPPLKPGSFRQSGKGTCRNVVYIDKAGY